MALHLLLAPWLLSALPTLFIPCPPDMPLVPVIPQGRPHPCPDHTGVGPVIRRRPHRRELLRTAGVQGCSFPPHGMRDAPPLGVTALLFTAMCVYAGECLDMCDNSHGNFPVRTILHLVTDENQFKLA